MAGDGTQIRASQLVLQRQCPRVIGAVRLAVDRRPAYTREVLAALAQCDGIADWLLLPNVEPGHEDVIDAFRQWKACESRLAENKERMGLNRNTQEALVRALLLRAEVVWTPWGWGMDRSRLAWLLANWCTGNPKCFTCKIKAQYRRIRRELFPVLSRIQNIGYDTLAADVPGYEQSWPRSSR